MSYLRINPHSPPLLWQHGQVPPLKLAPGFGAYQQTGDWSWEFFGPNADAFLAPADSAPQPAPVLGMSGDCGCGGTCGGCGGHDHGMGQTSGGVLGTGLFSSTDISTWGWGEWLTVAAGVYLGGSLLGDVGRGASSVRKSYRRMTS